MKLALDVAGRRVLVVGGARPSRRVLARYLAGGATVDRVCVDQFGYAEQKWDALISVVDVVVLVQTTPAAEALLTDRKSVV